ncbi:MAG: LysM peptidoglycan-binding domain-containing M23 family metallopeptidase [Chloroflexota bacterium]
MRLSKHGSHVSRYRTHQPGHFVGVRGRWPHLLVLIPTATLVLGGLTILFVPAASVHADPPSSLSEIPAELFRQVNLPERDDVPVRLLHQESVRASKDDLAPILVETPPPAVQPTPPAGPTHVVRRGDTLWQIAIWHRADLDLIAPWNDGIDPDRLVAGQRVLVPGGGPMPERPPAPRVVAVAPASPADPGSHVWPLPIRGTITTRFSARHPGIDIAGPSGTTVRAIAAGTVTFAGWRTNGGGFVVEIRHPDGMVSTYNHNREVTVQRGQAVARGESIATVGETGKATGPHLDLRVEMGGRLVNPLSLY